MDYEKILKEALNNESLPFEVTRWIEEQFPQLVESEDERVRKQIKMFIIAHSRNESNNKIDSWLAWLEKEGKKESYASETMNEKGDFDNGFTRMMDKEQKQLAKGEDYGIDGVYAAIDILKKTFGKVDGYETDDGKLEHECAISAVEQLSKQKKTAEWSEEDEGMLKSILNEYKSMQIEKRKWLYSLKDRVQPKQQGWSEEDEYCRHQLIVFCKNCMQQDSDAKKCANWLKFLKDRYTWKPSKEHLHTLEAVISDYTEQGLSYTKDSLNELYEQLKKL